MMAKERAAESIKTVKPISKDSLITVFKSKALMMEDFL